MVSVALNARAHRMTGGEDETPEAKVEETPDRKVQEPPGATTTVPPTKGAKSHLISPGIAESERADADPPEAPFQPAQLPTPPNRVRCWDTCSRQRMCT